MLNQGRGGRRQRAVSVRIATWATTAEPDAISRVENRVDLAAAWHLLNPRDQEVLALRAWDGLTDGDAAAVLGCTRATFTMRLTRARRRLANILGSYAAHVPITLATAGWEQP